MAYTRNQQRGVFVNSPQGGKKIGELINGVLHMNRDYKMHHYNKFPGWAMDKATLDANMDRIHAFMIHSSNRPTPDGPVDELLSFAPDNLSQVLPTLDIINFGHGPQYLFPDAIWQPVTSSVIPTSEVTAYFPQSTPVVKTYQPDTPLPVEEQDLPMFEEPALEIEDNDFVYPFKPEGERKNFIGTTGKLFNAKAVIPLLEAGFIIGYPMLGPDFYFVLEDDVLMLRKEGTDFSTRYDFSPKEEEERLFSILK